MTEEEFQKRLAKEIEQYEKAVAHFAEKGIKPQLNKYNALQHYRRTANTELEKAEAKKALILDWQTSNFIANQQRLQEYQNFSARLQRDRNNEVAADNIKLALKIISIAVLFFLGYYFVSGLS